MTLPKAAPTPPTAPRTRLQQQRWDTLVQAAAGVFLQKGYEAASMSEVIAVAGGSKATLYSYFQSKEKLFEAVMREEIGRRANLAFSVSEGTARVEDALVDIGVRFIELLVDETSRALFRISVHEGSKFPEVGQAFFESGPVVAHRKIADFLERAQARSELKVPDPLLAAEQFALLCQAKIVYPYLLGISPKPTTKRIKVVVEAAVQVFLCAYGANTRGKSASKVESA